MMQPQDRSPSSINLPKTSGATLCQLGFGEHLNQFGIGCVCLDATTVQIREANASFLEFLGLQLKETKGRVFFDLLDDKDRQTFIDEIHALCANKESKFCRDYSLTRKDGTRIWLQFTFIYGALTRDNNATVAATVIDITANRLTEQQLSLANLRFELAQEHAKVGSWEFTEGDSKIWWSKQLFRLQRLDPDTEPLTLEEFLTRVHPDDRKAIIDSCESSAFVDKISQVDYRSDPTLGPIRYFTSCIFRTRRDGKMVWNGTTQEITDRKLLVDALQESKRKYRKVVESTAEGSCFVRSDGVFLQANEAAANMLGYTPQELIGLNVSDLQMFESPLQAEEMLDRRSRGIAEVYEAVVRHRDGRKVWVLVSSNPMKDETGAFVGARATMIDITDRKKMEEIERNSAVASARLEMLSRREKEVLKHVVAGLMNKVIAKKLDISEKSVERHRSSLMKKLHVQSVAELVRLSLVAEASVL